MRLALKMKTRSATRKVEEVFCCEETREKREKKRGEERKKKERRERSFAFFPVVLFVFGQSDFFGCIPLKTSSSSLVLTRPSLNKNNSLSLYSKEHLSIIIFSSSQRVIIVLLLVLFI